jgi:hypothetical protein
VTRAILSDCCEDWILAYGRYYDPGMRFACLECGREWEALEAGRYRRLRDEKVWVERERPGRGVAFRYLAAADGRDPLTERCCAQIILQYGPRLRAGAAFTCPVCRTPWRKERRERGGLQLPVFLNQRVGSALTIEEGEHRRFLMEVPGEG